LQRTATAVGDRQESPAVLFRKKRHTCYLETPELLAAKLSALASGSLATLAELEQATRDGARIPPGNLENQVCVDFLCRSLLGRSDRLLHPAKNVHPTLRTHQERALSTDRVPRVRVKPSPKSDNALGWLSMIAAMHTHLPDQEKTILPYATRAQAHADYVLDREKEYKCNWWQDSLLDYQLLQFEQTEAEYAARAARYSRRQQQGRQQQEYKDAGDEKHMEPHEFGEENVAAADVDAMLEQHGRQRPNNEGCRYGNKLLGPKEGGYPEHPKICHRAWFLDVWAAEGSPCKHVQVRAWLPFAKCDDCIELRKLTLATKDREEQRSILTRLTGHLLFVRRERTAYALKRELAMSAPYRYMSIIIDGADQSAHDIPHSASRSHVSQACWKLKLHLMGVLVHGVGTFAYTCPAHLAQGHNVTIQALFDTLVLLKKKRNGAPFPPVLYLQLDNTTKQCKGKYLSAFVAMLVHFDVFKKVVVGFLPVGHTHEDIDQFFSRSSPGGDDRHHSVPPVPVPAVRRRRSCVDAGPQVAGRRA